MSVPGYQRVVDHIVQLIRAGELQPGDRLESIEKLSKKLGVSKTTIKTAHVTLRREGWVVGQQGKAVYVASNPPVEQGDQP